MRQGSNMLDGQAPIAPPGHEQVSKLKFGESVERTVGAGLMTCRTLKMSNGANCPPESGGVARSAGVVVQEEISRLNHPPSALISGSSAIFL